MEFFSFNRMITPTLIKIVFWLGLAASILFGLGMLIAGGSSSLRIVGLIYLILGPIMVRVYCEVLIVVFKMHETLVSIDKGLGLSSGAGGMTGEADPASAT